MKPVLKPVLIDQQLPFSSTPHDRLMDRLRAYFRENPCPVPDLHTGSSDPALDFPEHCFDVGRPVVGVENRKR